PGHAELARQAGFTAYLTKPVRHDQLQGCLRAVLGLASAMTEEHAGADNGPSPVASLITRHTLLENRPKPRVLVAEDNMVNQKLTVRMLDRLGYQPDVVSNGREALNALERSKYEAIVMDCQMPEMDGYEATRRIRQEEQRVDTPDKPHIPIIALTANAMQGDRDRCHAAGMDDYLAKPVKTQDLGKVLGRWVHAHPGTDVRAPALCQQKANGTGAFDADRMLANIGGDRDLFTQLVDLFLERYPAMMHDVQEALAHEDCRRLERSAHTLKGTAANLCASDVVLAAGQLEATGRLGNIKDASGLYVQLERKVQELAVALKDRPVPDKPA
ncbi:MAG: response regulator, partial [Nitrospiraceae bacterium]